MAAAAGNGRGMKERNLTEQENRRIERAALPVMLAAILILFVFFLRDILVPLIRLELRHDVDGARELLTDRGIQGILTVVLVEALQMVVVFIPAEFIQISSGLSYPLWLAVLLCDLGVCLGGTIIFVLVRTFHFQSSAYQKRAQRIQRLSAEMHQRNTVLLLYLLFFMPFIPFGAICYYGSGSRLPYRRYLLTVATAVLPSILVSNLMGAAGMAFLVRDLPLWLLVLLLFALAGALFLLIGLFIKRVCFRGADGTPDSLMYALIFAIVRLWLGKRQPVELREELLSRAQAPYILLANHQSFPDFYYLSQLSHPKNPSYLVNEYFCTRPILRHMGGPAGILSKKLFTPDLGAAAGILRMIRKGYPVVIFPEGRLSPDGRSNPIPEAGGALYKRLGVDLVLVRLRGAYFAQPKWRRRVYRSRITVTVERVVKAAELKDYTAEELDDLIQTTLYTDASRDRDVSFPQRHKAEGLETLLYRCPDCGALYTTKTRGNDFFCTACGSRRTLGPDYLFTDGAAIPELYDRVGALERKELDSFSLRAEVETRIFPPGGKGRTRRERGVCTLDPREFRYSGPSGDFAVPTAAMPALAFSCGKEFELYHDDRLHYFYPVRDRQQVARWALLTDLLAEARRERGTP